MAREMLDTIHLSTRISTIHSHYFPSHRSVSHCTSTVFHTTYQHVHNQVRHHLQNSALISRHPPTIPISSRAQHTKMCFYHAYSHVCGHTQMVLQQLCGKGQMKQQECARGQDGTILATVKVETPCGVCPGRVC
jgi:hypothetical protein